ARPGGRPRHRPGRPVLPGPRHRISARPGRPGRRRDHVLVWRGYCLLLGIPGADRPPAPRDVVDQLHLPRVRRSPVRDPWRRPGLELLAAGHPLDGRELAQLPPRRPNMRAAWGHAWPARSIRAPHLVLREGRMALRRTVARHGTIPRQANLMSPHWT